MVTSARPSFYYSREPCSVGASPAETRRGKLPAVILIVRGAERWELPTVDTRTDAGVLAPARTVTSATVVIFYCSRCTHRELPITSTGTVALVLASARIVAKYNNGAKANKQFILYNALAVARQSLFRAYLKRSLLLVLNLFQEIFCKSRQMSLLA